MNRRVVEAASMRADTSGRTRRARLIGLGIALGVSGYLLWCSPCDVGTKAAAQARPPTPRSEGASVAHVLSVFLEELAPVLEHPELRRRQNTPEIQRRLQAAARIGPERLSAESFAVSREISTGLSLRGLARLPLGELRTWSRIRATLARVSEPLCVSFWTGSIASEAEYLKAYARLNESDLRTYARLLSHATILELEASSPMAADREGLIAGINSIVRRTPVRDRAAFEDVLHAGRRAEPAAGCQALQRMLRGVTSMPPALQERYLRGLARAAAPI